MPCGILAAVAVLFALASRGTFVIGQSPSPVPTAEPTNGTEPTNSTEFTNGTEPTNGTELCAAMSRRSNELDDVVYSSAGVGAPLDVQRINWTYVASYLAPGFMWQDYSYLPSRGNYTAYRDYWKMMNADQDLFPVVEMPVREWRTCDPLKRRQVSQWREVMSTLSNPNKREASTSIYLVEFAPDSLLITRQAWWNSGNIANLVPPSRPPV